MVSMLSEKLPVTEHSRDRTVVLLSLQPGCCDGRRGPHIHQRLTESWGVLEIHIHDLHVASASVWMDAILRLKAS